MYLEDAAKDIVDAREYAWAQTQGFNRSSCILVIIRMNKLLNFLLSLEHGQKNSLNSMVNDHLGYFFYKMCLLVRDLKLSTKIA